VLFTSYQQMRAIHDMVSFEIEYPTLLQGTRPRGALLEQFRATPHCVLFATSSFLAGRGRAWRAVELRYHRQAAVRRAQRPGGRRADREHPQRGGNPFYDYQIPQAAIALKQASGG